MSHHLLEVTVISAQDLHPSARSSRTYAAAWAHPAHKLFTHVERSGGPDPTWNDKFVFRVDDDFLKSPTSSVAFDIFAARRFSSDRHLGTARVVLSAVSPITTTRFVAVQVRRPSSLRPQGILNLGVALLGSRSVPLFYADPGTVAFAHKDLIGGAVRVSPPVGKPTPHKGEDPAALERCGSMEVGRWAVERELRALESKLEKWRSELTHSDGSGAVAGDRWWRRRSCFCGGGEWER